MPNLEPKHETFCQLVVGGMDQSKAYVEAGFQAATSGTARAGGSKLAKKHASYIQELRYQRHKRMAEQVSEVLANVGGTNEDLFSRSGRAKIAAMRHAKLLEIVDARAQHAEYKDVPGVSTGYVAVTLKRLGNGPTGKLVRVAETDGLLTRLLLEHEERIARELGQWVEKRDDNITVKSLADLSDEEVKALQNEAARFAKEAGQDLETVQ